MSDWTDRFETACRNWQATFGLTDWTIHFKSAESKGDRVEAMVEYEVEDRHATFTVFEGAATGLTPERVALHEVFHLVFADMLATAAQRGSAEQADVAREEHRVIERLLNVMDGRP